MKKEFNLGDFIYPLKKRWYVIVIFLILGMGLSFFQSKKVVSPPPLYQVSSQILIKSGDENQLQMMSTYQELLYTDPVLKIINSKLQEKVPSIQGLASINIGEKSRIVTVVGTNSDKNKVIELTNTVTSVFTKDIPAIVGMKEMKIFSPAVAEKVINVTPPPPDQSRKYLMFIVGSLVLSLFPIYLVEAIRNTVRTEEEIEAFFGAPLLGSVKTISKLPNYSDSSRRGRRKKGEKRDENISAGV